MNTLKYWIAASYLPGIGARTLLDLLNILGDINALFSLTPSDYQSIGFSQHQIQALLHPNWKAVDSDLAWMMASSHHHILCYDDVNYPAQLKSIADPPPILYVQGDAALLHCSQVAMVGSRHPSSHGVAIAHELAGGLVAANLVVTSGLALGIDAASHEGALQLRGKTVAVFGTGLLQVYPRKHHALAERIVAQGGALLSELPLASPPRALHFPRRNRIISGLSVGVVVVEAAIKSGSLVTARHALSQGREVFAVPGSIKTPFARGCHFLIKQGAMLVENVDDILNDLGFGRGSSKKEQFSCSSSQKEMNIQEISALPLDLSLKEQHILSLITSDWIPFDQVLLLSRLTMGELSSMLLSLELRGLIQSVSGGYRRLGSG